jgi:FkbM family methyltransferase
MNPGWDFMLWEDPLDPKEFKSFELFSRCSSLAQVSDLVRLEILHKFGGFYVDWDCEPIRPLEPLRKFPLILGTENGMFLGSGVIGAEPGDPSILECLDRIINERRVFLEIGTNVSTGPHLVTSVLGRSNSNATIAPPEMFYPLPFGENPDVVQSKITPFTYLIHHYAHSWKNPARDNGDQSTDSTPEDSPNDIPSPDSLQEQNVRRGVRSVVKTRIGSWARRFRRKWDGLASETTISLELPDHLKLPPEAVVPEEVEISNGTYIGNNRAIVALPGGGRLKVIADDLSLTPTLLGDGLYDRPFWKFLEKNIRPGDRVVDVGANIGLFTVAMAKAAGRFGRVFAFEPDEEIFEVLTDNVGINWLDDRVSVFPMAVGSQTEAISFWRNKKYRLLSSASKLHENEVHRPFYGGDIEEFTVQSTRLDEILDVELPIRLIKIDVEGGEPYVLDGMTGLLNAGCVEMIDIEVIRQESNEQWDALYPWLRRLEQEYDAVAHTIDANGRLLEVPVDEIIALAGHFPHVIFKIPMTQRQERSQKR